MISAKKSSALRITVSLCAAILLIPAALQAQTQERDWYDTIAVKYKTQHAVITNYTRRMVIKEEAGKLVANSYVVQEKLLISDLSMRLNNREYIYSSHFNQLEDLNATVLLPATGGYKRVSCNNFASVSPDRDNVFYDDAREIVISYSSLLKNAITETKYTIEHSDLNMLPPCSFQKDIPVVNATFEITAPKNVNISFVLKGENTSWIKQEKEEKDNTIVYRFTASDVPAMKIYEDVPSASYYIPHIVPYITSYKLANAKKPVEMLSSTAQLYKYLYKNIRSINLKEDTFITATVADLTKNDKTDAEKAAHIYQWVQKNMHYVAFEAGMDGFVPREAGLVCKRKYGDCKDMTSVLVTMFRKAGLNASYTWIGTREKPYVTDETPTPIIANHMICALKMGEEYTFVDGTHPLIPFGRVPEAIQGKEAIVAIDKDNFKVITVPVTNAEKNLENDITIMSFEGSTLKGNASQSYAGYRAWDLGLMMMYNKNEDREKKIRALARRGTDKYHQDKYTVSVSDTAGKEVSILTAFSVEDYVRKAGKQYFVNMNIKRSFADRHIDATDRTTPYYYPYKEKTKEVVVLELPKGYRVAHVPAPTKGTVDGMWNYTISYKAEKDMVTLTKEYELNTLTANSKQIAANNKMVDDLKKAYRETVVLTAQ